MMMVLSALKIPTGLFNSMRKLSEGNQAYLSVGGIELFLLTVVGGVLRGCPLSGSLLVICMDLILFMLPYSIVNCGLGDVLRSEC